MAATSTDGNWQISPDKLRLTLDSIDFQEALPDGGVGSTTQKIKLSGCNVAYDLAQPGLTKLQDCPFVVQSGTYGRATAHFNPSYDILIDDSTNGIFTDPGSPTKLSKTAPDGGGQFITVAAPASFGGTGFFVPPVVVKGNASDGGPGDGGSADGGTPAVEALTVSVVVNGLQFFQATLNGGSAVIGVDGKGNVSAFDSVVAVGVPAAVSFYANPALGTARSYNGSNSVALGTLSISVLYSNATSPSGLNITTGQLPGCGPIQQGFYYRGGFGYLGLDPSGVLGWASGSEVNKTYTSVMSLPQVATLGATTTFKCLQTTTDPAPPGGSFSSGAPSIPNPTLTQTMKLMAH